MRRSTGLVLLASVVLIAIAPSASAFASPRTLTVLYTNDLHLRFERLVSLTGLIEAERASGAPTLLVDAGDAWHDFRRPVAAVWGADAMIDWMNEVGYDAMALGNHDLYWGFDRLAELSDRAQFPLLGANLSPAVGYDAPFAPSIVRRVDGIRVLLIGVTTPQWLPYPDYPWLRYLDPAVAITAEIEAATASGDRPDLIVAIGHLPIADAVEIVGVAPAIDLFITGHSHEVTRESIRVGDSVVVQTGAFGERLGRLVLEWDESGEVHVVSGGLLDTEEAPTQSGRGLLQLLAVTLVLAATALLVLR